MKRIILSAIIALGALAASAQVVNASRPQLLDGVTGDGSVISPDGKYVVTSTARGIERIPFGGGEAAVVSNVMGAYKLAVSPAGNNVVFRRAQVGEDHMRRVSLENVDMRTGRANVVIAPTRNMDAGFTLKGNAVTAVTDGKVLATRLTAPAAGKKAAPAKPAPLATIHYGHLQMTVDGVTTTLGKPRRHARPLPPRGPRRLHRQYRRHRRQSRAPAPGDARMGRQRCCAGHSHHR